MTSSAIVALVLLVLGLAPLVYQRITCTTHETVIDVGPLHATVDCEKALPLPRSSGSRHSPAESRS